MRSSVRRRIIAAGVALTFATAACGSDDGASSDDTAATTDAGSPDSSAAPDDSATDASSTAGSSETSSSPDSAEPPSGTLRFGTTATGLQSLDPLSASASLTTFGYAVFDALIYESSVENFEPGLAESWEVDEAAKTVTLQLRSGVTFHDGTPFDAEAVKANFDRAKTLEPNSYASFFNTVQSVIVNDPQNVTINFDPLPADALLQLSRTPGWMLSPTAFAQPGFDLHPVGTGPYQFVPSESTLGQKLLFELYPGYWDPSVQGVEQVESYTYDSESLLNAIELGEVDIAQLSTGAGIATVEAAGVETITPDPSVPYLLWIPDHAGNTQPALGDERVREAMRLAIDIQGFIDGPNLGYGEIASQYAPAGSWAHVDSLDGRNSYDLDRARELMEEAGYSDGFSCNGLVGSGSSAQPWMEYVARALSQISITMNLEPVQGGGYLAEARTGKYNCIAMTHSWTGDPGTQFDGIGRVPSVNDAFGPLPDDIMTLADQGAATAEQAVRKGIYEQLYTKLFDAGIVSVMFSAPVVAAVQPGVTGQHFTGQTYTSFDPRDVRLDA